MLSPDERRFLAHCRIAHLATADTRAVPHVVPVCYAIAEHDLYITVDQKPKREGSGMLKRIRNILENPAVALIVDRYDEDWSLLGWVMVHGRGEILAGGAEHDRAQALLRSRYQQLQAMEIGPLAVIAMRIERSHHWGNLEVAEPGV